MEQGSLALALSLSICIYVNTYARTYIHKYILHVKRDIAQITESCVCSPIWLLNRIHRHRACQQRSKQCLCTNIKSQSKSHLLCCLLKQISRNNFLKLCIHMKKPIHSRRNLSYKDTNLSAFTCMVLVTVMSNNDSCADVNLTLNLILTLKGAADPLFLLVALTKSL